ncbi:hypothetical protein [Microbacterium sp.]|uniref:hypothetical protein n=1 Tax=Microbacterium sp. TaxID=51671 RepID=UPI003C717182
MAAVFASSTWIDDAGEALQDGHVYLAPGVNASGLADALAAQIGDSSIGVAVFSDEVQLQGLRETEVVDRLQSVSGYDTIVIAVDGDLFADSQTLGFEQAMTIANQAEQSAGGLQPALTQTVQEIAVETTEVDAPSASGGGVILAIVIGVAVLVAAAATTWGVLRSRRRGRGKERGMPEGVRARVAALRALIPAYAAVRSPIAQQTAADLDAITTNVTELFARLDARTDTAGQRGMAAIEYDERLRKLQLALDRDYLLDILTHPHLWDDPDERVAEVRQAVTAVADETLENVRQVNARRALHFQVSLDGLIGGRKELREWDRAFDSAADDGAPPRG